MLIRENLRLKQGGSYVERKFEQLARVLAPVTDTLLPVAQTRRRKVLGSKDLRLWTHQAEDREYHIRKQ